MKEYEQMYEKDRYFRNYVDKYCTCHDVDIEEALQHKVVQEYAAFIGADKTLQNKGGEEDE